MLRAGPGPYGFLKKSPYLPAFGEAGVDVLPQAADPVLHVVKAPVNVVEPAVVVNESRQDRRHYGYQNKRYLIPRHSPILARRANLSRAPARVRHQRKTETVDSPREAGATKR